MRSKNDFEFEGKTLFLTKLMFKHLKLLMQPVFQQTIGAKHIIATANSSCDDNAEKIEIERCLLHLKKNRTFISQLHSIHT